MTTGEESESTNTFSVLDVECSRFNWVDPLLKRHYDFGASMDCVLNEENCVKLDCMKIMREQLLETMIEVAAPDSDFGRMKDVLAVATFRATHSVQKIRSNKDIEVALRQVAKKCADTLEIAVHANWEHEKHFNGKNADCVHTAGTLKMKDIQKPVEATSTSDGTTKTRFMCSSGALGETPDNASNKDSDNFDLSKLDHIIQKRVIDCNDSKKKMTRSDMTKLLEKNMGDLKNCCVNTANIGSRVILRNGAIAQGKVDSKRFLKDPPRPIDMTPASTCTWCIELSIRGCSCGACIHPHEMFEPGYGDSKGFACTDDLPGRMQTTASQCSELTRVLLKDGKTFPPESAEASIISNCKDGCAALHAAIALNHPRFLEEKFALTRNFPTQKADEDLHACAKRFNEATDLRAMFDDKRESDDDLVELFLGGCVHEGCLRSRMRLDITNPKMKSRFELSILPTAFSQCLRSKDAPPMKARGRAAEKKSMHINELTAEEGDVPCDEMGIMQLGAKLRNAKFGDDNKKGRCKFKSDLGSGVNKHLKHQLKGSLDSQKKVVGCYVCGQDHVGMCPALSDEQFVRDFMLSTSGQQKWLQEKASKAVNKNALSPAHQLLSTHARQLECDEDEESADLMSFPNDEADDEESSKDWGPLMNVPTAALSGL